MEFTMFILCKDKAPGTSIIMSSLSGSPSTPPPPSDGAKSLQERLNLLLSKLSTAIEIVKTWPTMDGDDASIHVKTTSKLIVSIQEIVTSLKNVEGTLKADAELRNSLKNCPVPINLLDLLDHGNGLNPDCFSRGLLRESMGQLAGLKRRKLALEMLGSAVQAGLNSRNSQGSSNTGSDDMGTKRQRSETEETMDGMDEKSSEGPVLKKTKTEPQ